MPTLGPVQSQVYVDVVLGQISIAYQDTKCIADTIFPELQVNKRTGIYYVYDNSSQRIVDDYRAPRTRAQEVEYGLTKASYGPLIEHALEQAVEWEVESDYVAPLNPDIDATNNLTKRLTLSKEVDAFNQASNTSVVTQTAPLSGTSRWNDAASAPINDIQTACNVVKKSTGADVGELTVVLGYEVYTALRNHATIVERIKYSQLGILTTDLLAQVFGVKRVVIAEATHNTANALQNDVITYVWGKNAWVMLITDRPAPRTMTFGYTLRMGGRQVTRWTEQWKKTDYIRVEDYYQQLIVAPQAAYLYTTAVA